MKVIATSNFRNTSPSLIKLTKPVHDDHVHKGAEFEIDEKTGDGKQLLAQLNASGRLIRADDKESVERLNREIATENAAARRAEESAKKLAEK